jgi:hypothetical protein
MTFTVKLEQADGTPAEPPTMESTVTNWRVGDTIPIGRDRTLSVTEVRDAGEPDGDPVLVVSPVRNGH